MKNNETYHGYTYQKRCALFYLLDKFFNNDFIAISLEHPNGDDFDLHFKDKKEVYQTKDYCTLCSSNMKDFILNMWRKYSENINNPKSTISIELAFIFSKLFKTPEFIAIKNRNLKDKSLNKARAYINNDPICKYKPNKQDWDDFLNKLHLYIHTINDVETGIIKNITLLFNAYNIKDDAIDKIKNDLLEKLDTLMSGKTRGHISSKNEIQEQIDSWHTFYWRYHPKNREKALKQEKELLMQDPEPSISSSMKGVV